MTLGVVGCVTLEHELSHDIVIIIIIIVLAGERQSLVRELWRPCE